MEGNTARRTSQEGRAVRRATPPPNPENAACRDKDPGLFFPIIDGKLTGTQIRDMEEAKAICASCPERRRCLNYAVTANETDGIWGGKTHDERVPFRRRWLRNGTPAEVPMRIRNSGASRRPRGNRV